MAEVTAIEYGTRSRVTVAPRYALCLLLLLLCITNSNSATITGTVSNSESGQPLSRVTVLVEGSGRSMPCNDVGQYRLLLDPGLYRLKFSHVSHNSEWFEIEVADTNIVLDVSLRPAVIQLSGMTVYKDKYNPAQRIILKAIARKKAILSQLQSYQCKAYTKQTVLDPDTGGAASVKGIVESQIECFWEQPNKYKEIIVARKQTSNVMAELNTLSIEEIPNFNMNRIQYGIYSIVSPTADDALKYYNYFLLDTIFIDGNPVFRLEVEPKKEFDPLVRGTIDIADSTFAVVGGDGYPTKGASMPGMNDFHYSQRFALFEDKYWMPIEIRYNYETSMFSMKSNVDYVAALHDYIFDIPSVEGRFDYALEVSEEADNVDSVTWYTSQLVPLTPLEESGYQRLDSIASLPPKLYERMGKGVLWLFIQTCLNYDLFHFNRIEGAYLGSGHYLSRTVFGADVDVAVGYSFSHRHWQYRSRVSRQLPYIPEVLAGIEYHDDIRPGPTIPSSRSYNPTFGSLGFKSDPLDYNHERGFGSYLLLKPVDKSRVYLRYHDYWQSSVRNHSEYSFFGSDEPWRENPAIEDGRLRSFSVELQCDSRKKQKIKGREQIDLFATLKTQFNLQFEIASPDLVANDFDFLRYQVGLKHIGHTILPGITTFEVVLGGSEGTLPPQKHFRMRSSYRVLDDGLSVMTLGSKYYRGDRAAALYMSQNFGTWIFQRSRLPLIKDIPFSLSIFGAALWTDFRDDALQPDDEVVVTAEDVYSELGFSLGRISSLLLRFDFAWQMSDYDTRQFHCSFGFGF